MMNRYVRWWNQWLEGLVRHPDDDEEMLLAKKVWMEDILSHLPLVGGILGILTYVLEIWVWFYSVLIYCGFFLVIAILFFLVRRGLRWFSLAAQLFLFLFSFVLVIISGGILHSGGTVFIGLNPAFSNLGLPYPRRTSYWLGLYLFAIILEVILEPYITPLVTLSETWNLLFFVMHFVTVILIQFQFTRLFAQQQMRIQQAEAEKLKLLDAAKNRFFANISHEFRTPLTIILGMVDRIQEQPEKWYAEGLQMIRRNGQDLLELVNQILELSKLEANVLPVHYIRGDIIQYLRYLIESFQSLAEAKKIQLSFAFSVPTLEMDYDEEKLKRIITNLLVNAIKFTPQQGTISLSVGRRKVKGAHPGPRPDPGRLEIKIKDTGIGIPKSQLPHIFDRFYRSSLPPAEREDGQTDISEGIGLGLTLVKDLVGLMAGEITVESAPGQGAEFTLLLPIRQQALTPGETTSVRTPKQEESTTLDVTQDFSSPSATLLIVEDNADVVTYLQSILEDYYSIKVAANGQAGIDLAIAEMPDLIISDVMMPVKDGFALCEALKKDQRTSHIPIILLTAKADMGSKLEGLETGADAYLTKPFTKEELMVRIRQLIELRKVLQKKYAALAFTLSDAEKPANPDEEFLIRAVEILRKNYTDENFDVSAFCRQINLSRSQLHKKLKSLTGKSATEFIRSFRLHKARELLRHSKINISEIAYDTGFSDPAYFTRAFTREFGHPPHKSRE